jgi:hypothetical protein
MTGGAFDEYVLVESKIRRKIGRLVDFGVRSHRVGEGNRVIVSEVRLQIRIPPGLEVERHFAE